MPYPLWIGEGLIEATPGNVIDYAFIRHRIRELGKVFKIREVRADPWNATQILQQLQEEDGFKVERH